MRSVDREEAWTIGAVDKIDDGAIVAISGAVGTLRPCTTIMISKLVTRSLRSGLSKNCEFGRTCIWWGWDWFWS